MSNNKKRKYDFPNIPLYMQSDKVLDRIFNDENGTQTDAELDELQEKVGSLSDVAFSGSYNDLKDLPSIKPDGSYDDTALVQRVTQLEEYDKICITNDCIASSDEVLAMYK